MTLAGFLIGVVLMFPLGLVVGWLIGRDDAL